MTSFIKDEYRERRRTLVPHGHVMRSLLGQALLHSLEQFALHQRRLRSGMDVTLIGNLSKIEAVAGKWQCSVGAIASQGSSRAGAPAELG